MSVPAIGIYFSSPGCPACGEFTPYLMDAYDALRDHGRPFEVVLAASSRSDASLLTYMRGASMPWPAVPVESDRIMALVGGAGG